MVIVVSEMVNINKKCLESLITKQEEIEEKVQGICETAKPAMNRIALCLIHMQNEVVIYITDINDEVLSQYVNITT